MSKFYESISTSQINREKSEITNFEFLKPILQANVLTNQNED